MAWIESNQGVRDHPKTLTLASRMGWDIYATVGRLHCFWWWCLDYAPTGDLRKLSDAVIAQSVGLDASKGSLFVSAMVEARWLDRGRNMLRVHDWVEYAGRYLRDSKFKNKPEKWQEVLNLYKIDSRQKVGRQSAVLGRTAPNQPIQEPRAREPVKDSLPNWMPLDAWTGFLEMRKAKKKEPTAKAIGLIIQKIGKWREQGHDPTVVLNSSTVNGWTDVYEPKTREAQNGAGPSTSKPTPKAPCAKCERTDYTCLVGNICKECYKKELYGDSGKDNAAAPPVD